MSELSEVVRLIENLRSEFRENFKEVKGDMKEVKAEVRRTNGRVGDHEKRITVIETNDARDSEGKKRWKDFVPTAVGIAISCSLSILIYGVLLAH